MTDQELQKLIDLDNEYECSLASREQREPEEIADDILKIINKLIADKNITDINNEEDAYDYIDFIKHRY